MSKPPAANKKGAEDDGEGDKEDRARLHRGYVGSGKAADPSVKVDELAIRKGEMR